MKKEQLHQELLSALDNGTVSFDFIKANGEFRSAIGTRHVDLIMLQDNPSHDAEYYKKAFQENDINSELILFYDLENSGIRSVRPDTIVPKEIYFQQLAYGSEFW